jgi:hypothetical protein
MSVARFLTPRRAVSGSGDAEEPPGHRAGSRPCRRTRLRRCTASSTPARGERQRCGRRRGLGGQLGGMGAGADTLGTSSLRLRMYLVLWARSSWGLVLRRRYEPALRWASPEGSHAGGIFRGQSRHESATWIGDGHRASGPGPCPMQVSRSADACERRLEFAGLRRIALDRSAPIAAIDRMQGKLAFAASSTSRACRNQRGRPSQAVADRLRIFKRAARPRRSVLRQRRRC